MKNINKFNIGATYSRNQIASQLGNGSYSSLVVKSKQDIICVRFRPEMNPSWESRKELWIHTGKRRINDATQWINQHKSVPVFCKVKGGWKYLGFASATLLARDEAAVAYTKNRDVGLVLRMHFKVDATKVKITHKSKRAA